MGGKQPAARRHVLKISVAFPVIAFTACAGKGIDVFTCNAADISYVGSIAGWLAGAVLAPYYADATVRMAVGICLAVVVILVLLFVFTEQDVRYIVENSYFEEAGKQDVAAVGFSALTVDTSTLRSLEPDGVQSAQGDDPAQAVTDNLANARDPKYGLSQRELEIPELFAQGRSANWIAENFFISKNTVRSHLRNIYGKLDVHTRQELLDLLNGKEE